MSSKGWLKKISDAENAHKEWLQDAKDCWKRYTGETKQNFNIFKSNTDILLGALFNEMPKPDIRERFAERNSSDEFKSNLYLNVATVADRCVQYNNDNSESKKELTKVFRDAFVTGRGIGKVDYDYTELQDSVEDQIVPIKHIAYTAYIEEVCDKEEDITWKGEIIPMTKKECADEFGIKQKDLGTSLQTEDVKNTKQFVKVYEIWDKPTKTRIYISPDYKENKILRTDKDPLELKKFFPYEKEKTIENGKNTLPTPEYNIYKQLNEELQNSVGRRGTLTKNQVVYRPMFDNAAGEDLKKSFNNSEGTAIPINGDPKIKILDKVAAVPTEEAQQIVAFLGERSQELVMQIWQVTGVSDIMRGETDAKETATAQKIKGVFGSLRIKPRQESVQEMIKSIFRKQAEIVCEKYTIDEMQKISCVDLPTTEEHLKIRQKQIISNSPEYQQMVQVGTAQPIQITQEELEKLNQPTLDQVAKVLRDDKMRGYSIDIETTATIFDDIATQREQIQAFTLTLFNMIDKSSQYIAQTPSIIDLMEQMTMLNVSQFKVSRGYIDSIKGVFKRVKAEVKEPKEQAPDPAMLKLQQDQANKQQDNQLKMAEMQLKGKELDLKMINERNKLGLQQQAQQTDEVKTQADIRNDAVNTSIKQQEADRKDRELVAETSIAIAEIQTGLEAPTIAGDVGSVG